MSLSETPEERVSLMAHGVAGSHSVSKVSVFLTYHNTTCHLVPPNHHNNNAPTAVLQLVENQRFQN